MFYISLSLHKSEYNYPITELERTAAYYCVNKFIPYISGDPYQSILYSNYQPLVPIIKKCNLNSSKHAR